jgi:two-component system phosphate regulon sensor histidine kinase PhoR
VGTLFTGLEPGAGDEIYQRIKEELLQGKHSIKLEFKAHQATLSLYGNTFDEDDEACVLVVQDISELKRLEQIRRDFVANVSHELKTPITSIQGSVETLLDGALEDKADARKFVEMIGRQAFRLALIFNDMLALSRIEQESDGREIERVAVDLRRLLTEGIEACRTRIEERGVEVALDCVSGLIVKVNSRLMVQALVNLIENGIKYSESGSQINVRGKEEFKTFSIEVSDQGRGIAAKHLPRLFERFYRVDESRDRKEGGTGLGLAIVKHIVQAHRGTVTVESELKVGTTFKIVLPSE